MVLKPRISEKAYALSQSQNVYVIEVPSDANKLSVASAVKSQFDVAVTNVNMANIKGKSKRTVRKGGRQSIGTRSDTKKAYITLKSGDSIAIFANEEDEKKDNKKTSPSVKKAGDKK